jgi:hypothetical protein
MRNVFHVEGITGLQEIKVGIAKRINAARWAGTEQDDEATIIHLHKHGESCEGREHETVLP